MLTNILLTCVLGVLIGSTLMVGMLFYAIFREYRSIRDSFSAFINPVAENTPSPLANVVEAASVMVARSIMAQFKTYLMGVQSGAVRGEKGLQADIAQDAMAGTPIGSVLSAFPTLRKSLRRNPGLLDIAMGLLANRIGFTGQTGASATGNNGGSQPQFSLKI